MKKKNFSYMVILVFYFMNLQFLNELKKDKERRRLQNKRYRERYREILNLKKQLDYHKKTYEKKAILTP